MSRFWPAVVCALCLLPTAALGDGASVSIACGPELSLVTDDSPHLTGIGCAALDALKKNYVQGMTWTALSLKVNGTWVPIAIKPAGPSQKPWAIVFRISAEQMLATEALSVNLTNNGQSELLTMDKPFVVAQPARLSMAGVVSFYNGTFIPKGSTVTHVLRINLDTPEMPARDLRVVSLYGSQSASFKFGGSCFIDTEPTSGAAPFDLSQLVDQSCDLLISYTPATHPPIKGSPVPDRSNQLTISYHDGRSTVERTVTLEVQNGT